MMIFAELISKSSLVNKYGMEIITEIFYSLAVLIVMLLFKNSYVFTNKKEKFTKGVFLAIPMLVMTGFYLINSIKGDKIASLNIDDNIKKNKVTLLKFFPRLVCTSVHID